MDTNTIIFIALLGIVLALAVGIVIGARIHRKSQEEEDIALRHHNIASRQLHKLQYERRQWS